MLNYKRTATSLSLPFFRVSDFLDRTADESHRMRLSGCLQKLDDKKFSFRERGFMSYATQRLFWVH